MLMYQSNKGGGGLVDFETAILAGYAPDGGLYVPVSLPTVSPETLEIWKPLSYQELAFEVLSLFIDRSLVSAIELKQILAEAYSNFEKEEVIPLRKLTSRKETYIMELFYGPTISFKDVGMAFIVTLVNFFLRRKQKRLSIIVATTGDTGPAAAHYIAGKSNLDAWVLYPKGLVTEEQERQMTTLFHDNVHAVAVRNCAEGGDDLDLVIQKLYDNQGFKEHVHLSSVNSINWGRVMMQTVHYFYGYLKVADYVGEPMNISVPSGAFGNLCAGGIAKRMGLPVSKLLVANNSNACLHRIFSKGVFSKAPLIESISSAIDILVPLNFWRFLYFCVDYDTAKIASWMAEFEENGKVDFDKGTHEAYSVGFLSTSVSEVETQEAIKHTYESDNYVIDPHGAVALAAADQLTDDLETHKLICLATAHPAKFPDVIKDALAIHDLPDGAKHRSIELQRTKFQRTYACDHDHLETALKDLMVTRWDMKN